MNAEFLCGNCSLGVRSRTRTCGADCAWGSWGSWGSCSDGGACAPNVTDHASRSCGNCLTGTQSRTRTCSATCAWGAWGSWGVCVGSGACVFGSLQASNSACGNCGTRSRTRTCNSSCGWGSWGSWGSCRDRESAPRERRTPIVSAADVRTVVARRFAAASALAPVAAHGAPGDPTARACSDRSEGFSESYRRVEGYRYRRYP